MTVQVLRNGCRHKECPALEKDGKCLRLGREPLEYDGEDCPVNAAYRDFYSGVHRLGYELARRIALACAAKRGEVAK